MMFPPSNAQVYYNEAGEPLGWDLPGEPDYCDIHGLTFMGAVCPECEDEVDDEDETVMHDRSGDPDYSEREYMSRNDQERDFEEERFNAQLMKEE